MFFPFFFSFMQDAISMNFFLLSIPMSQEFPILCHFDHLMEGGDSGGSTVHQYILGYPKWFCE